jgi:hypothetical protein
MNKEPVLTTAGIAAAVGAILTMLTVFGVKFTPAQITAILGVVTVAGPIVGGLITRAYTYNRASIVIAKNLPESLPDSKIDAAIDAVKVQQAEIIAKTDAPS